MAVPALWQRVGGAFRSVLESGRGRGAERFQTKEIKETDGVLTVGRDETVTGKSVACLFSFA